MLLIGLFNLLLGFLISTTVIMHAEARLPRLYLSDSKFKCVNYAHGIYGNE